MKLHWKCKCGSVNYFLLDRCSKCHAPGGLTNPHRTQDAGVQLKKEVIKGSTFAVGVVQGVSDRGKRSLDKILGAHLSRRQKALKVFKFNLIFSIIFKTMLYGCVFKLA